MRKVMCCPTSAIDLYGAERKSDQKRVNGRWQRKQKHMLYIHLN